MKRKKMMLLLWVGFVPFLFGFRFGGEITYNEPVKFQHDSVGNNIYQKIAAGDVNGDGVIDLIMIRNVQTKTAYFPNFTHEVRIYKNKGPSLPIQDMFAKGTHQGGQGDNDSDSVQIYKEEAVYDRFYTYDPLNPNGSTTKKHESKPAFYSMALTYTTMNSKKVVDSIYIGAAYPGQGYSGFNLIGSNYCASFTENVRKYYYAGKILQLKNPYVYGGGNPFGKWKRVQYDRSTGDVVLYDGDDTGFPYNEQTYILRSRDGELYATHDGHKTIFQTMAAGDYKGNGTYELCLAPWRVWPDNQGGSPTIQNMWGMIYKLTLTRYRDEIRQDFWWGDALPGGGYGISQFFDMQAVDIDKDGKDDLLLSQGSSVPLSWIKSRGNNLANQNSYAGRLNSISGSFNSVWAANLRLRADLQTKPANNLKGVPDLVSTSGTECKVWASYYASDTNAAPLFNTYSEWNVIYDGTGKTNDPADVWMWNLKLNNVIAADVDNDGENEIIVTTLRTSQFWILKKSIAKYLTMLR